MNSKSTKRALISSAIALVVCIAMLIGTTFAWFTDNVSSANNIIKSGNLDVVLEYSVLDADGNWTAYAEVLPTTKIFNYENWEPGYTSVAKFKVTNNGSLALKYQLTADVVSETAGVNVAGEEFLLSEFLKYGITDVANLSNRDSALGAATEDFGTFGIKASSLESGFSHEVGVVIAMPADVTNDANHNGETIPSIEFGVNLVATQEMSESDSFGTDYDKLADYDGEISGSSSLIAAFNNGGNYKVISDFSIPTNDKPIVPEGKSVALDLNGHSITTENSTEQYAFYNLGDLTLYDSNATTTYSVISTAGSINARGIYNGRTPDGEIIPTAKITVLNGVYNALGTNGGAAIFNYGTVNIKSGTFTSVGGYSLNNQSSGTMFIETATVNGGIYNVGDLVINDGDIATTRGGYTHAVYHAGTNLVINGGMFTGNGNEVIHANDKPATINGGTFKKVEKTSYLIAGSKLVINDGIFFAHESNPAGHPVRPDVTIKGGTFNYVPTNVAEGYKAVTVNGSTMIIPDAYNVTNYSGLYNDSENNYYVYSAEGFLGLNELFANNSKIASVNIMADIDMDGATWNAVKVHQDWDAILTMFDGNNHTISNMNINGQALFTTFTVRGDAVIKDIIFDNVSTTYSSANAAIVVSNLYSNITLDNVDIVNCSITGGYKVAPYIGTVYNENSTTVTATLKNCDVSNTVVKALSYDFCTTAMVAFVYEDDNDKVVFENCTVNDVALYAPNSYTAHANVYTAGSETLYNDVNGVTVNNVTFENI